MSWVVECDCGTPLLGETEDEVVVNVLAHAKDKHGITVTREQILGMAEQR